MGGLPGTGARGDDPDGAIEPLLRIDDVCRITQLSRAKVCQLVATGELPSLTIGRARRIEASALRGWIAMVAARSKEAGF